MDWTGKRPVGGADTRTSKFSEEQTIGFFKQHGARSPMARLRRDIGIGSLATYNWKSTYSCMEVSGAQRSIYGCSWAKMPWA